MVHHACTLCSLSRRCPPCYTVLWVGSPMAVLPHTLPAGRLCRLPKSGLRRADPGSGEMCRFAMRPLVLLQCWGCGGAEGAGLQGSAQRRPVRRSQLNR